jgi:hypothetical protein
MDNESACDQPPPAPPLEWPDLSNDAARHDWYRSVIAAYADLWEAHPSSPILAPVGEHDLANLETRLGCALPPALRSYHSELGALSLAETLCSAVGGHTPIQPLMDAYPGVVDLADDPAELALARELVVFGDYLGNGNMFCFHRTTGEVYYFDHDTGDMLTRFFSSTEEYLDALMIRCLAEIHEDDDAGEALLAARFGSALVTKWLY